MRRRQFLKPLPAKLPEAWLLTDERMGDALWPALRRLPRGAGVIVRHLSLPPAERRALTAAIRAATRGRHLILDANDPRIAKAHNRRELVAARGKRLVFVSPVFATRTHPRARVLGRVRFGLVVRGASTPVAALGGVTVTRYCNLRALGATAWGAIDAWL